MGSIALGAVEKAGVILALLSILSLVALPPVGDQRPVTAESPSPSPLSATARALGWSPEVTPAADLPGQVQQVVAGDDAQPAGRRAVMATLPDPGAEDLLGWLEWRGGHRGLFHGWEAVIAGPDEAAHSKAVPGVEGTMVPAREDGASSRARGFIGWHCGPYGFLAEDATGAGQEARIAEALYEAAQQHGLCALGSALVVLAETEDVRGQASLTDVQGLARAASRYYAFNSYGRVQVDVTFLTDTHAGAAPWVTVPGAATDYTGDGYEFGVAALRAALADAALAPVTYLERVLVVCAVGEESPSGAWPFCSSTLWLSRHHALEIQGRNGMAQVYVPNVILIAEHAGLGTWVHELGHTLRARYQTEHGFCRIEDRYNDDASARINGQTGFWDVMGHGNHWGAPEGSAPTHMSSFSKEAAGWLGYVPAALYHDYELTSVEHQRTGDAVLILNDPFAADPTGFYILEARDADAPFGAPESGVVIYHVDTRSANGRVAVAPLSAQRGDTAGERWGQRYQRPTLHGADDPEGAREYIITGGLRVRLLAESFVPYRARVRIERVPSEDRALSRHAPAQGPCPV